MRNARFFSSPVLIACLGLCVAREVAANAIITDPGPGSTGAFGSTTTAGYDFTVGVAPIFVNALGLWDQNQDGFTNAHSIGLWDNAGNLVTAGAVAPGTVNPLSGEFRYATLPMPVMLQAGTTYVLGATYVDADADRFIFNTGGDQATFDPAVTPGNARGLAGFLVFPSLDNGAGSFVGPNAQFSFTTNSVPASGPGLVCLTVLFLGLFSARCSLDRRTPAGV